VTLIECEANDTKLWCGDEMSQTEKKMQSTPARDLASGSTLSFYRGDLQNQEVILIA
jgi:hypothetical protein